MIALSFSKQQVLDADLKAIQQINFTGNLDNEKEKETILDWRQNNERKKGVTFKNCAPVTDCI